MLSITRSHLPVSRICNRSCSAIYLSPVHLQSFSSCFRKPLTDFLPCKSFFAKQATSILIFLILHCPPHHRSHGAYCSSWSFCWDIPPCWQACPSSSCRLACWTQCKAYQNREVCLQGQLSR